MPQQEPIMPTTCDHCGERFNTSRQHPRKYCSIACEEGRAPLPMDDPQSPDYFLHLQGNPEALVGTALVAKGLEFSDYSPDWHRNPEDYDTTTLVSVDREEKTLIRKSDVFLGKVVDYDSWYTIEREDRETGEITTRRIKDVLVVDMIRRDRWWVDG